MQINIAQVKGLAAAIATIVTTGANLGSGSNVQIYENTSAGAINFDTLAFDTTFVTPVKTSNVWAIKVNTGTGNNQIVQLNGSAQIPAVSGALLTALNASNIASGSLALARIPLTTGNLLVGVSGTASDTAKSAISLTGFGTITADFNIGGSFTFTGLRTPTGNTDAATKLYVDSVAQGLAVKLECQCATTANITLSGLQTIDGYTTVAGDRVLVKNQTTTSADGIYIAGTGSWTRATDFDTWSEIPGAFTFVLNGTVNGSTGWVCNVAPGGTIGTTAITFVQFGAAVTYSAGVGITLTGTVFSAKVDGTTVYTDGSSQIAVKSSGTAGQTLLSAGSGSASWGALSLSTAAAITGTLPVANGGTGFATIAVNTVVCSTGTANTLSNVALAASTVLGRLATGNIVAVTGANLRTLSNTNLQRDTGTAMNGSMTLVAALSQTPATAGNVMVFYNGLLLKFTTDYTITSGVVTATNALNVQYGGTTNDGLGFQSTDVVEAIYNY